jgi:hypothetical protein
MEFYFVQASPQLSFPLPDQRPIGRNPGLKWSSEGRGYSALIAQMWIEPPKLNDIDPHAWFTNVLSQVRRTSDIPHRKTLATGFQDLIS